MSIMSMIIELAEKHKEEHPVDLTPWCEEPRRCWYHEKFEPCEKCAADEARGYRPQTMTGRRANGAQRDAGRLYHAVPLHSNTALCNAKPGRRSDWSPYADERVTCTRCIKILNNRSTT